MIRMTPQLQSALEAWKLARLEHRDGDVYGTVEKMARTSEALEAAYRAAPDVTGRWEVAGPDKEFDGWWVYRPQERGFDAPDQRTAEAYRDALNAADAALEGP